MGETLRLVGGRLVLPDRVAPGDVLIRAGKVAALGEGAAQGAEEKIRVDPLLVAPGFLNII